MLNPGYGRGYSVREVIEAVKQASGVNFAVRLGDPARLVAANARIQAAFGWQPRGTGLNEIARSALDWEKRLLDTTLQPIARASRREASVETKIYTLGGETGSKRWEEAGKRCWWPNSA